MESGAALRASAISAFRSGIRYCSIGAMFGYRVWDCACICRVVPTAITCTQIATAISLGILPSIHSLLGAELAPFDCYDAAISLARCIDHTNQYVCQENHCQRCVYPLSRRYLIPEFLFW